MYKFINAAYCLWLWLTCVSGILLLKINFVQNLKNLINEKYLFNYCRKFCYHKLCWLWNRRNYWEQKKEQLKVDLLIVEKVSNDSTQYLDEANDPPRDKDPYVKRGNDAENDEVDEN